MYVLNVQRPGAFIPALQCLGELVSIASKGCIDHFRVGVDPGEDAVQNGINVLQIIVTGTPHRQYVSNISSFWMM